MLFSSLLPCFSPLFSYSCGVSWIGSHVQPRAGMHDWTEREGRSISSGSILQLGLPKLNKTSVIYSNISILYILEDTDVSIHNSWLFKNVILPNNA